MSVLKMILLLLSIFLYILFGSLTRFIISVFNRDFAYRVITRYTKTLSTIIRKILGIRITAEGELSYFHETGNFIIANHLGYLDGIILSSLFRTIFITKIEIKSWPVFGWMARVGGTIFVNRQRNTESIRLIPEISETLRKKRSVLFFPECTSGNGRQILNFKRAYFQAPIDANAAVVPITIRYTKINSEDVSSQNKNRIFWYGQVSFPEHLLNLLKEKQIEAKIIIHPKIETKQSYRKMENGKKQLCEDCFRVIAKDFIPV